MPEPQTVRSLIERTHVYSPEAVSIIDGQPSVTISKCAGNNYLEMSANAQYTLLKWKQLHQPPPRKSRRTPKKVR